MTPVAPRIGNEVSCVTRINHENHFSWQAQYLVKSKCHFSWQVQYFVKFGMTAGTKMLVPSAKSNLGCADGFMLGSFSGHSLIMLGTVSDRSRIVNVVSAVLVKFLSHFGRSFFVAGTVFGEVGQ